MCVKCHLEIIFRSYICRARVIPGRLHHLCFSLRRRNIAHVLLFEYFARMPGRSCSHAYKLYSFVLITRNLQETSDFSLEEGRHTRNSFGASRVRILRIRRMIFPSSLFRSSSRPAAPPAFEHRFRAHNATLVARRANAN